jgi:hypothetical protein
MMEIAARAIRGVKLLSRKQTRKEIMRIFKEQMTGLRERLNVCTHLLFYHSITDFWEE